MRLLAVITGALVFALSVSTRAEDVMEPTLQSDWLELVKGHRGETMGVELRDIEEDDGDATQKITLAIPKRSMPHPDAIEEVVVVGRAPDKPEPLPIKYEWLDDYDNDNYGLVIRIGKNSNWPIRIFMNSEAGFTR